MLVRPHALEPLQHLVALDRQAARGRMQLRQQRAPDRMRVQDGARRPRADDLDVQQRLGRGPRAAPGDVGTARSSISRICCGSSSPLNAALGVIQRRSGSRFMTTLKLPLVPKTQPRASKRRPARQSSSAAFAWVTGVMIQIIGASTARASFRVVATMGR